MLKDTLQSVLELAHSQHEYRYDIDQYGKIEHWEVGLVGDCEDFALWCRQQLDDYGIPSDLVYCKTETGEGHLVLHVYGWILDNRHRWVMRQDDLPYEWLRIGKPDGRWWLIKSTEGNPK